MLPLDAIVHGVVFAQAFVAVRHSLLAMFEGLVVVVLFSASMSNGFGVLV